MSAKKDLAATLKDAREKKAKRLSLRRYGLKELPREIGKLAHLEVLDLGRNELRVVPGFVGQLTNLRKLRLVGNPVEEIHPNVHKIPGPLELDLSSSGIERLPKGLLRLDNIDTLDLSHNPLGSLLGLFICRYRKLLLRRCGLKDLHPMIGSRGPVEVARGRYEKLENRLRHLDLSGNDLQSLPGVEALENLEWLSLAQNRIDYLSLRLRRLRKLSYLDIGHNRFEVLPRVIGLLPELRELWGRCNNDLERIDADLGALQKLEVLVLVDGSLREIPELDTPPAALRRLSFAGQRLRSLPGWVTALPALEELVVHKNQLARLPAGLARLPGLRELDVSTNDIRTIPAAIKKRAASITCHLDGNPATDGHSHTYTEDGAEVYADA